MLSTSNKNKMLQLVLPLRYKQLLTIQLIFKHGKHKKNQFSLLKMTVKGYQRSNLGWPYIKNLKYHVMFLSTKCFMLLSSKALLHKSAVLTIIAWPQKFSSMP